MYNSKLVQDFEKGGLWLIMTHKLQHKETIKGFLGSPAHSRARRRGYVCQTVYALYISLQPSFSTAVGNRRHHRGVGGNLNSSRLSSNVIVSDRHRNTIPKGTQLSNQVPKSGIWLQTLSSVSCVIHQILDPFPLTSMHLTSNILPYPTELGLGHETCLSQWSMGGSNNAWIKT